MAQDRPAPFVCFVLGRPPTPPREVARRATRSAAIHFFDTDPMWRRRRIDVMPMVYDEASGKAWRRTSRGWFQRNWHPPRPTPPHPAPVNADAPLPDRPAPYWTRD